jgi:GNAT superfamily N-acetyltransferase
MIRLERITDALPASFEAMRAEARDEGHRMLETLAIDWATGKTRFGRDGETLFAAHVEDVLAGIGGLTQEPALPGALRLRRFYVRVPFRRGGVGRALAKALLEAATSSRTITVNAAAGSEAFWLSLGFAPDRSDDRTHILTR